MQKNERIRGIRKALGLFCALVLLVCALYVPFALSVSAISSVEIVDDTPFVFDFEDTVTDDAVNKAEAQGEAGIGYYGWGPVIKVYKDEQDNVINSVLRTYKSDVNQSWSTSGGYRLHTEKADGSYGFYELAPSSKYIVSFKIRVLSAPRTISGSSETATATIALGYNGKYVSNLSGSADNYINVMETKIPVMSSVIDSETWTLFDSDGKETTYAYGEEWHEVTYFIDTPASFTADPALSFWVVKYTGLDSEIDDVSVTKLGADSGIVKFVDTYSGTEDYVTGKIGTAVTLPDISGRAQNNEHTFEGWYMDADRTVKAEDVKFSEATQSVYSRWNAPVTITFKDAVNNTEKTITGSAGDSFTYPADPVDPSGKTWFMGWYKDNEGKALHNSGKFGYANETLYAYFKGEIPGITQDFENYTKDAYTVQYDANGQAYKSNRLVFGTPLKKQSEVTFNDSKYAVKFHWNPVAIDDKNNENYYDVTRYRATDNYFHVGNGLEDNQVYVVNFKYKAEKVNAPVSFYVFSGLSHNGWGNRSTETVLKNFAIKQSDEWQEATIQFTTSYAASGADHIFLGVSLTENEETVIYFDDVEIEAFAQPYESLITINTNVNDEVVYIKGDRGDKIQFPELTHPENAPVRGYYLDKELTIPYESEVYERLPVTLFVKWGNFAMRFEEYIYEGDRQNDPSIQRVTEEGIGNGDDHAMRFYEDREADNTTGLGTTNAMLIADGIKHGTTYKVKYDYKVDSTHNVPMTLSVTSADKANMWWAITYSYSYTTINIPTGGTDGWKTAELVIQANVKTDPSYSGNAEELYLRFSGRKYKAGEKIDVLIDNVLVEEVTEPCIFFNPQTGEPGTFVSGKIGDEIQFPTVTHPEDAKLMGWCTDALCTTRFTETTITEPFTVVYAKWGAYNMTFKEYPYEGNPYADPNIHRETAPGLGNGDDHAMRWHLKRAAADNSNVGTSKAFAVQRNIAENGIYKIKFDYKVNPATNRDGTIGITAGAWTNIWWNDVKTSYPGETVKFSKGGTNGWKTKECYINFEILEVDGRKTDTIYITFSASDLAASGVDVDVLIDNVKVELVEAPYVYFEAQNGQAGEIAQGKVGEEIKLPAKNPERIGYDFAGWYLDKEGTVKFDQKTFTADTAVIAYAKWTKSATSVYSFENYTLVEGVGYTLKNAKVVKERPKSGEHSLKFSGRSADNSSSFFALEDSGEYFKLEYDRQYMITFNYYIKECDDTNLNVSFTASWKGNIYNGITAGTHSKVGAAQVISSDMAEQQKGKWSQKVFYVDTNDVELLQGRELDCLYVSVDGGETWEFYIDDIVITQLPKGKSLVVVDNGGSKDVPTSFTGAVGADFSSKLPENPVMEGKLFKGYFTKSADGSYLELTRDNMKFGEKATLIFARFLDYEVNENFDNGFYEKAYGKGRGYTLHDFDYEVYDSEKEGNSKDNVCSGRYSLHRKGNSMYNENSVILTLGNQIAEGERYRVTFKVKLGKHFHTDGAVKIVSSRSYDYAWTTTGDYYAVAPIADLTDGQWHEVSYVFNSVEAFVTLQTPGYVEVFMDDFKFELVDESVALSEPPVYTEYVAAKRDANGNVIKKDRGAIDISTIIDSTLSDGSSFPWLWVIIGAAVLLVAGGAVAFILISKKKSKKA